MNIYKGFGLACILSSVISLVHLFISLRNPEKILKKMAKKRKPDQTDEQVLASYKRSMLATNIASFFCGLAIYNLGIV